MSQQTLEPEVSAVQALLSLSDILACTRQQRYCALWVFADKLVPAITRGQAKQSVPTDSVSHELPLLLFAVASLVLAMQSSASNVADPKDDKQVLGMVYTIACSALGDSFSGTHSSSRLQEAAAVVKHEIGPLASRQPVQLTSDYLSEMHFKIQEAGLATFQCVALDTCYAILEVLYASADYRSSQPLECGGKLLAAAIIASAFAMTVEPEKVSSLPFLSWLSDLSKHPKDIIKAQTRQIVACLLQ